jgi:phosphosulfolactate synthase
MERLFCDFLDRAPRSRKPRANGITIVGDHSHPPSALRELLDAYGEYADIVKLAVSLLWTAPSRFIEERVKLYRDYRIDVLIDDPIFAIAYHQGKAERFLRTIRDIGFTHCQIDTHFLTPPQKARQADEDEKRYASMAKELGLKLLGEVGHKWEEGDTSRRPGGGLDVSATTAEVRRLLALGCEKVFLEARVIREVIGAYGENEEGTEQIRQVVQAVGQESMIIENTGQLPFDTRMAYRFWAVRNFGPEVNMGGGEPIEELRYIEGIRRGVTFAKGPSRSSPMLWVKSLARNGGRAAEEWWKEEYPIDPSVLRGRSAA